MYDIKELYEARTVEEAVALRLAHPEAGIIAGGSDVLIKVRDGKEAGRELISIYGIEEIRGVSLEKDGTIRIGALTSFKHLSVHPLIQKYIPVLGEAVDQVGGPQIRSIGTIGGNTCNGVTSADSASTLMAWDARVELRGPEGRRVVKMEDFYLGAGKADVRPGEIETAILIPKASYLGYRGHYIKYGMRNAMEIATTGCSVNVKLSDDKQRIEEIRIGFGVAAPVPIRAKKTEEKLKGCSVEEGAGSHLQGGPGRCDPPRFLESGQGDAPAPLSGNGKAGLLRGGEESKRRHLFRRRGDPGSRKGNSAYPLLFFLFLSGQGEIKTVRRAAGTYAGWAQLADGDLQD